MKHPSDAKRYWLELGVGDRAKEAYERWYAFLDQCQDCYNNVDVLNKALWLHCSSTMIPVAIFKFSLISAGKRYYNYHT